MEEYLLAIKELGRQIDSKIIYGATTLTSENINQIKLVYKSEFFKTIMYMVDIDTDTAIPKDTEIEIQFGVLIDENYQYRSLGKFITIDEPVFNADNNSYTTKGYTEMIKSMISYDENAVDLEFPVTHKQFVSAIAENLGWTFTTTSYCNSETLIDKDIYVGTGMTVRAVLDDLCVATMGNMVVTESQLEIKYPVETNIVLDDEFLKDDKVEFKDRFGVVNSLVLTRSADSDSIYRQDEQSIEQNGLCEIKIADNMLLSREDRNNYIEAMFNQISGFYYDTFDVNTIGVGVLKPLDRFTINHDGVNYSCIMMNGEFEITQGLRETLYTNTMTFSETDYKYADVIDRIERQATIIADKQNAEIEAITSRVTDVETLTTTLRETTDEFLVEFKRSNGNNLIKNSVMRSGTAYWFKEVVDMYYVGNMPENPVVRSIMV